MKIVLFALTLLTTTPALAKIHEVRMFSRNDRGAMVYEPDFLQIAPGDQIRFIPEQPSHNAATIEGMIPQGAEPFKSNINEDFTTTLTVPGTYGIKCSPHFAMGMVMLIEVGEGNEVAFPEDLPKRATERFEAIRAADTE